MSVRHVFVINGQGFCPCACNQGAYADNLADVVGRLLFLFGPYCMDDLQM